MKRSWDEFDRGEARAAYAIAQANDYRVLTRGRGKRLGEGRQARLRGQAIADARMIARARRKVQSVDIDAARAYWREFRQAALAARAAREAAEVPRR